MLDGVVDVVRRHVDRQPDGVAAELLDLRLHPVIQAEARRAESSCSGELGDPPLDLVAELAYALERLAGWILEAPVDVGLARQDGADVAAAHRDDDVRPGRVGLRLELARRPVGEVVADLGHRLDDLRVQRLLGAAPGRADLVPPARSRKACAICERPALPMQRKRTFTTA